MTGNIDLFTPWREAPEALQARLVGRDQELAALLREARAFLAGGRPLPIFLYGPRGTGKSHLLALVRSGLEEEARDAGVRVVYVGEDIPAYRSPADLIKHFERIRPGRGWRSRTRPAVEAPPDERRVVLLEGFDRQLAALGKKGRWELRRELQARPNTWIIATGVALDGALTATDEAFFGAFAAHPLGPLTEEDAGGLLDHLTEDGAGLSEGRWRARREALLTLAGGSPRALMALGLAVRDHPDALAADDLLVAIQGFTAHYQQRYRDLPPDGQQLVTLLAEERRELMPAEAARILGWNPQKTSVLAHRLVDAGALTQRTETKEEREEAKARGADVRGGAASLFTIAEPLFRYWLEYRTAPWEETRIGMLGRFLEELLSEEELASAWLDNPDTVVREAAAQVIERTPRVYARARNRLSREVREALTVQDDEAVVRVLKRFMELPDDDLFWLEYEFSRFLANGRLSLLQRTLGGELAEAAPAPAAIVRFFCELPHRGSPERTPEGDRAAFGRLLSGLAPTEREASKGLDRTWWRTGRWWVSRLLDRVIGKGPAWELEPDERRSLARTPLLRAPFVRRGRIQNEAALISGDEIASSLSPDHADLHELLWASVKIGSSTLFEATGEALLRRSPPDGLGGLLMPGEETIAPDLDLFVRLATHTHHADRVAWWPATLAALSPVQWQSLVRGLEDKPWEPPHPFAEEYPPAYLTALAVSAPDRLAGLRRLAPREWTTTFETVETFISELQPPLRGRLHPELEGTRRALEALAPK